MLWQPIAATSICSPLVSKKPKNDNFVMCNSREIPQVKASCSVPQSDIPPTDSQMRAYKKRYVSLQSTHLNLKFNLIQCNAPFKRMTNSN